MATNFRFNSLFKLQKYLNNKNIKSLKYQYGDNFNHYIQDLLTYSLFKYYNDSDITNYNLEQKKNNHNFNHLGDWSLFTKNINKNKYNQITLFKALHDSIECKLINCHTNLNILLLNKFQDHNIYRTTKLASGLILNSETSMLNLDHFDTYKLKPSNVIKINPNEMYIFNYNPNKKSYMILLEYII